MSHAIFSLLTISAWVCVGILDTVSEGFRAWLYEKLLSEAIPGPDMVINMALPGILPSLVPPFQ
jgi:hypothetical protein